MYSKDMQDLPTATVRGRYIYIHAHTRTYLHDRLPQTHAAHTAEEESSNNNAPTACITRRLR